MSSRIIKLHKDEVEEKYFELLGEISKDDGFKSKPSKEDIKLNKELFESLLTKYRFLDTFLVNFEEINHIIKASVYPECIEEYIKRTSTPIFEFRKTRTQSSIYNYFIKDNYDILDYNRFALAVLDVIVKGENSEYAKMAKIDEMKQNIVTHFNSIGKENFINALSDYSNDGKEDKLIIYNYNKIIGKKIDKGNPISLSSEDIRELTSVVYPSDIAASMKYSELSKQTYEHIYRRFGRLKLEDKPETDETIREELTSALTEKKLQPYMDYSRFYKIAMYRLLQCLDGKNGSIQREEIREKDFSRFLNLVYNVKKEVEKNASTDSMDLPVLNYITQDDCLISFIKSNELLEEFEKIYKNFLDYMVDYKEDYAFYLLREPKIRLTQEEFFSFLDKIHNKADYLYLGYSKAGIIGKEELYEKVSKLSIDDQDSIANKLIINNDPNLQYFIDQSLVSIIDLRRLYDNGTISATKIRELTGNTSMDVSGASLKFSGIKLAELYKIVYSKDILNVLQNKENYSEADIKRVYEENNALKLEVGKEELKKFKRELKFQSDMFKEFAEVEDIDQFVEALGDDLGISSYITLDLFNKGIISKEQAESMDGIFFKKFITDKESKKYERTINSRDVLSNQNKLLNLISHKRISITDIIKLYSKGIISADLYHELENEEYKGKVDSKYLTDLAEKLKVSGKNTDYDEIERYFIECKKYAETEDFFKGYDDKIIASKKIDNLQLIELGRRGLLSKSALSKILERGDLNVIIKLIKGENTIDLDTIRELFLDLHTSENKHFKRDLLEKFIKLGNFSNDEIFTILLSTYRGMDEISEEQKELNNQNFQYLLNRGILSVEINEEYVKKNNTERRNKSNESESSSHSEDTQIRFPLFERFDCLFAIDKNTIVNKKGPALVFKMMSTDKTIIETLGTVKDEILVNDKTDHRTFIMDSSIYERYKNEFTTMFNGSEVIQYKKLISWFDENKDILNMEECKHTKNWKNNVRRKAGLQSEECVNNDINLAINSFKDVMR